MKIKRIEFVDTFCIPRLHRCDVLACREGAVMAVSNYPGTVSKDAFKLCPWHLRELYEQVHKAKKNNEKEKS